ncbi:methyltransferase [Methanospirillum lacunae]|uniref:Methyltransferase small domain-containing protein n=1 Tax=Methanospirillum lacunae TaxID=668570 RepID=A0A2V2MY39_9EURY|nr:methyltransferase [Methanospirillum lacunae]PWR72852.1 hypothetical protein DK846_07850 [Methanospirillum lacunae]
MNIKNQVSELSDCLHKTKYKNIIKFPLRKYPFQTSTFINEIQIIFNFIFGRSNLFSISLFPHIYLKFIFNRELGLLRKILFLNEVVETQKINFIGKNWLEKSITSGLIKVEGNNSIRFLYRIVPYRDFLLITSRFDRNDSAFTYLSYDSLFFADFIRDQLDKRKFRGQNGLDICCGVGILSLVMSRYCTRICGVDLNPASINLAQMNAELHEIVNCEFFNKSFQECNNNLFDLVVANPPFIHFPKVVSGPLDSDGGEPYGLGITIEIIHKIPHLLKKSGRAYILTRSPIINGIDFLYEHMLTLLPDGFSYTYHDLSDSIGSHELDSNAGGIECFHHVIIDIVHKQYNHRKKITYPFLFRNTHLF